MRFLDPYKQALVFLLIFKEILETVARFIIFAFLITFFMFCFFLIRRNGLFLTYLLSWLQACFLPSILSYIHTINSIYKNTMTGNFSKTTLTKLLKFCNGTLIINCYDLHKNWQKGVKKWITLPGRRDHGTLNFKMKMYVFSLEKNVL